MRRIIASLTALLASGADDARGDRGSTATEYAVLVGFIAVAIAAALWVFGMNLSALYDAITGSLSGLF